MHKVWGRCLGDEGEDRRHRRGEEKTILSTHWARSGFQFYQETHSLMSEKARVPFESLS